MKSTGWLSTKATVALAIGVAVVAAAACGSSSSSKKSSGGTTTATTASTTTVKLNGPPVKVGLVDTEGVAGIETGTLRQGAEVGAKYVNTRGGIGGRRVEIVACNDKADPAGDASCAQQFVDAGVVAVAGLGPTWGDNGLPITAKAGIPFVGIPVSNAEFISPGSYPVTGGSLGEFPALAKYEIQKGAKKASIIYADLAAGKLAADALLGDPLKKAGVEVTEIPEKTGAPDFTPAVVKANGGNPDVIFVLFASADCARIAQAAAQVGVKATLAGPGSCAEDVAFGKVDKAVSEGAVFATDTVWYEPSDPETKIYRAALKQYEASAQPASMSGTTFATVMTLKTIGDRIGAGLDAKSVLTALRDASGIKVFMATTLDKANAAKLAGVNTNVYATDQRIVKLKGGRFVDANGNQWMNGFK
jgi:ABC-type branched-subunit amino acid transport system substrate-binding protein